MNEPTGNEAMEDQEGIANDLALAMMTKAKILTKLKTKPPNKPDKPLVWCEHLTLTPPGIKVTHPSFTTGITTKYCQYIRFCPICGKARPK